MVMVLPVRMLLPGQRGGLVETAAVEVDVIYSVAMRVDVLVVMALLVRTAQMEPTGLWQLHPRPVYGFLLCNLRLDHQAGTAVVAVVAAVAI